MLNEFNLPQMLTINDTARFVLTFIFHGSIWGLDVKFIK